MERLLRMIPGKKGTILDVACGKGATTRYLTKYYAPENITGINISQKQLQRAEANAPRCHFLLMSATDMNFDDESFDAVLCVEAAFHFDTRLRFLTEARRVLHPGGYLVLSDILFHRGAERSSLMLSGQNWIADPEAYRQLLRKAGFHDVRVTDATHQCLDEFDWHLLNYVLSKFRTKKIDWKTFQSFMFRRHGKRLAARCYVLASGRKEHWRRQNECKIRSSAFKSESDSRANLIRF
jgi:MPBQ/MSBQ methyltransferase